MGKKTSTRPEKQKNASSNDTQKARTAVQAKMALPPSHPSSFGAALQHQWNFLSPCLVPTPANLGGKDHQTCAAILS